METGRVSPWGYAFIEVAHRAARFSLPPLGQAAVTVVWRPPITMNLFVYLGGIRDNASSAIGQLSGKMNLEIVVQATNLQPQKLPFQYDPSALLFPES
jgi:hypothetical protein